MRISNPYLFGTAITMNVSFVVNNTSTTTTIGTVNPIPTNVFSEYGRMSVICNVIAFAGTSVSFAVQEAFPLGSGGSTYLTTAQTSGTITAAGTYFLTNDDIAPFPNSPYTQPSSDGNPLLGRGTLKKILIGGNAVTSLVVDFIGVFYN